MSKEINFAAVYDTVEDYRKTPLMLEFFFYGFGKGKYAKTLGLPSYDPNNIIWLTMCPGYTVTQNMSFQFLSYDMVGLQLSSVSEAALVFPDISESPTLIAYEVSENGDIVELGRLVGEKTGPEVFAWAAGFYSGSMLPVLGASALAVLAYSQRKKIKSLLNA